MICHTNCIDTFLKYNQSLTEIEFNEVFEFNRLLLEESKLKDWMKKLSNTSKEKIKAFALKRIEKAKQAEAEAKKNLENNNIPVKKLTSAIDKIAKNHKNSMINKLKTKDVSGLSSEGIDIAKEIKIALHEAVKIEDPRVFSLNILKSFLTLILLILINTIAAGFIIGLVIGLGGPVWMGTLISLGLVIPFIEEITKRGEMRKKRSGEFFFVFNAFELQHGIKLFMSLGVAPLIAIAVRVSVVGMHFLTMVSHKTGENIAKKLEDEGKYKEAEKVRSITFGISYAIHAVWNIIAILITSQVGL